MTNPRNPYPHEIGYDPHVWLPSLAGAHQSLEGVEESHEAVLALARRLFPEIALASHVREHKLLVQSALLGNRNTILNNYLNPVSLDAYAVTS
ncbi:MAG: hypothetical protein AAF321_08905 [Pseudomonadota bacterium]